MVLVVILLPLAWLSMQVPPQEESGEVKLTVADADFPGSVYIHGYEPIYITVTLSNPGSEIANQSRITVTLNSNVDARVYTWTKGDIAPGFPASETFWVNVNTSSRYIYVKVSYDGKEQDEFTLRIF